MSAKRGELGLGKPSAGGGRVVAKEPEVQGCKVNVVAELKRLLDGPPCPAEFGCRFPCGRVRGDGPRRFLPTGLQSVRGLAEVGLGVADAPRDEWLTEVKLGPGV